MTNILEWAAAAAAEADWQDELERRERIGDELLQLSELLANVDSNILHRLGDVPYRVKNITPNGWVIVEIGGVNLSLNGYGNLFFRNNIVTKGDIARLILANVEATNGNS